MWFPIQKVYISPFFSNVYAPTIFSRQRDGWKRGNGVREDAQPKAHRWTMFAGNEVSGGGTYMFQGVFNWTDRRQVQDESPRTNFCVFSPSGGLQLK